MTVIIVILITNDQLGKGNNVTSITVRWKPSRAYLQAQEHWRERERGLLVNNIEVLARLGTVLSIGQ